MEEFEDWEFIQSSETALSLSTDLSKLSDEIDGDSFGENEAIKADYFALDSGDRYAKGAAFAGSGDNPNREFLAGIESASDESADDRIAQDSLLGSEKGEIFSAEDSETEKGFEKFEAEDGNSENNVSMEEPGPGDTEGVQGFESRDEKENELGSDECVSASDKFLPCEGEKRGILWLNLPFELLKMCVSRVRPVWSISIAAAFLGFLMLGRRLYKIKRKSRRVPLKVNFDDKKASQFARATRLNEAFSVVKHMPILRSRLPTNTVGVTLWPAVAFL